MKKTGILNSEISKVISDMGHMDMIMIGDCGLPIDSSVKKIDLALKKGSPSFIEVCDELLNHLVVEKIIYANEVVEENELVNNYFNGLGFNFEMVSHEDLKLLSLKCRAVIRTGECSPYANVILVSGVDFEVIK